MISGSFRKIIFIGIFLSSWHLCVAQEDIFTLKSGNQIIIFLDDKSKSKAFTEPSIYQALIAQALKEHYESFCADKKNYIPTVNLRSFINNVINSCDQGAAARLSCISLVQQGADVENAVIKSIKPLACLAEKNLYEYVLLLLSLGGDYTQLKGVEKFKRSYEVCEILYQQCCDVHVAHKDISRTIYLLRLNNIMPNFKGFFSDQHKEIMCARCRREAKEESSCARCRHIRNVRGCKDEKQVYTSPLHAAVFHKNMTAVSALIEGSAYLNMMDRLSGETPLSLARRLGYTEIEELLKNRGAQ